MNRKGNYRNIGNNFVQGETFQVQVPQQPQPQRQTRSAVPAQNVSPSINIQDKTEASQQAPLPQQPAAVPQQPAATPMTVDESAKSAISEEELLKLRKINFKKKTSGKEKRTRLNKKLLRMLTPRNAIAALNELYSTSINDTTVVPVQGNKFEAEIVLNNIKYQGVGNSKMGAKNNACEKALRDLVINKFQNIKAQDLSEDASMDGKDDADSADQVPMLQLASFALHKLFAEWEAEGFQIPLPKIAPENPATSPSDAAPKPAATPKPPKIRTELPPNNLQMHPVMLLSVMRPCTQYNDLGAQGVTPNIMHTVGCTVDGQSFIAQGRSKKEARKRVATDILMKMFDWKGSCC